MPLRVLRRFQGFFGCVFVLKDVDERAGEHIGAALRLDLDLSEHLADDDFDMFIVDIDAGVSVRRLDFFRYVILYTFYAACAEHILQVD